MGTTAEKLAYLDATKTAIKDAIVAKGVEIPEGTTFRQYADLISGISTGLSDEDLALADATPEDVKDGKTFYAGDRYLKTGTGSIGGETGIVEFTVTHGENKSFQIPAHKYISIFWNTSFLGEFQGARLYEKSEGTFNNLIASAYSDPALDSALKIYLMINGDNVLVSVTEALGGTQIVKVVY